MCICTCIIHVAPSARGDLEILAYCLLQWSSGCLPWDQHVKDDDKDSVARMKIRYSYNYNVCFSVQVLLLQIHECTHVWQPQC